MTPPLWAHQRAAIEYARERPAAYLAMGMGTGKTRCAVELTALLGWRRVLVVCPLGAVDVWPDQYRQFAVNGHVSVLPMGDGPVPQRVARAQAALEDGRHPAVCVANYACLTSAPFREWALRQRWDGLVVDEAHRSKAPGGTQSRFLALLARGIPRRLALSGTPMPHSPLDLYAQYRWLEPSVFGTSLVRFRQRYCIMGGYQDHEVKGWRDLPDLEARAGRIMFQVGREVLDLPEATDTWVPLELSGQARLAYHQMQRDLVARLESGEVTAANAMVRLLRLQQLTGGTLESDAGVKERLDTGKEDWLADWLLDVAEPVVVFCRFRADLDAVHGAARRAGRVSFEVSGRMKELEEWRVAAARGGVLAVQIQAGGEGIDLTAARLCVYYSVGFSLGDYEQSRARLHRPGQRRAVAYYHLVMQQTVDAQVYGALRERRDVVEEVLAGLKERVAQ